MLYVRQISTDANTTKDNAVKTQIRAWAGVVTRIVIRFPPGPKDKLHVVVKIGALQIFPVGVSYDVTGDDEQVVSQEYVEMKKGWNNFNIFTWNDSEDFSHDCIVRITVLPKFVASPQDAINDIARSLRFILRRIGLPVK